MSFEEWMGPIDPEIDMTGYNRMKRAYQEGHAEGCKEQKERDIEIAEQPESTWTEVDPRYAISAAIRKGE